MAAGLQSSSALSTFCNALSILNSTEVEQVWSNTCLVIQALLLPVLGDWPVCSGETTAPPGPRVSRSLSLSQLLCNYDNWTDHANEVDAGLVTLCSENDGEAFIQGVCNNVQLMQALEANPTNSWIWNFCVNSSEGFIVSQFCRYETWTESVDPSMVGFCWDQDQERLKTLLCENLDFFTIVFSNVENIWLMPNCTEAPTEPDRNSLVVASCRYSDWLNMMDVTTDMISFCVQHDDQGFVENVCANATLLNKLQRNSDDVWVGDYCKTVSRDPPVPSSVPDACTQTDLALCAALDSLNLTQKVCADATVLRNLLANRYNSWLLAYCVNHTGASGGGGLGGGLIGFKPVEQCQYSNWTTALPDAGLMALCWDHNNDSFVSSICPNTVLLSLLKKEPSSIWVGTLCTTYTNFTHQNTQNKTNSAFTSSQPAMFLNFSRLLCDYGNWTDHASDVDTSLVTLCSLNDKKAFSVAVCNNTQLLKALVTNPQNNWLWNFCVNSSKGLPMNQMCSYSNWMTGMVDPLVVGLCWQQDQVGFQKNVCCNALLVEKLTSEPLNKWLSYVCVDNETMDILPQVCRYSDWKQPVIVDMTDLALCAELDPLNFTKKVCADPTALQNLLANLDNTWLVAYCINHTGPSGAGGQGGHLMGFKPVNQCQYLSWTVVLPDPGLIALCWDNDHANFTSSVCTNTALLSRLKKEPYSLWVGTVCTAYIDGTRQGRTNSTSTDPQPCLVRDLLKRLNWTCTIDFSSACQPGSSQTQALQILLRCGLAALRPRLTEHLTTQTASMLDQATSLTVVLLVALEESQMISLPVTESIHFSVLESVVLYLEKETDFEKKRVLLQCFGKVLTSLMQTGRDVTSDRFFLIKEYFRIPLASLRAVLSAVDFATVREITQYYSRNQATLQLTEDYLSTMISVFFQTQLVKDGNLFPELTPLLALASPADIQSLPPFQTYSSVIKTINGNIGSLSVEQRRAFGKWYSQAFSSLNITAGGLTLIRDTGNLIVYLPLQSFQHLSPAQLLDGMDIVLVNTLSPLQQQFVAESLIGTFRNLTAEQFRKLGNLTCLSDPVDLLLYRNTDVFSVILDDVRTCVIQGRSVTSDMIFSLFLNVSDLQSPGSLSADRLSQLAPFLPWLGVSFLQKLNQSQLNTALTALSSVPFTPSQASIIVDKVSQDKSLALPRQLQKLGSLVIGVKVETLWSLTSDTLLSSLPDMALHIPGLNAPQANAITTKLWDSPKVTGWLDKVEPLLSSTPLLCVMTRARDLVANVTSAARQAWNTQQAKTIFKEAVKTDASLSIEKFLALGSIAPGVSCTALQLLFKDQPYFSSARRVLALLRGQSVPLHTSLKKCIIEKLYNFNFFSQLLGEFGAQIALALPMTTITRFSSDMMNTFKRMIVQEPQHFLLLPSIKQDVLVDKIVQRLGMYTGEFTENEFRSLGIMATYVVDEVFVQLARSFFVESLEFLRKFCYNRNKRDIVAQILQEPGTFGPVQNWTLDTLNQVDRFLFFFPRNTLQQIPQGLMTQGRIERLFLSQHNWESGPLGALCVQGQDQVDQMQLFEKQQFVLQYFLGFLKAGPISPTLIPTCEKLHTIQPSTWSTDSLTGMSSSAFSCSLELFGQDPFFSPYQKNVLLQKTKEIYGPARSFTPPVITQLGQIATQLSVEELSVISLSELRTVSALGALSTWNSRQLVVLASSVLNHTKVSPSQLGSSTLVAIGHILCGFKESDMRSLNPVEFSKAVLWLGRLRLTCSEAQQQALVGLLSNSLAFGPMSSWGTEVFIEIGSLAAGLPDMAMSSLVEEQIEGLTPLAVSLIQADKFAIVFNPSQISMFSYEQAKAVTDAQRSLLSPVQLTALSRVLTSWDNKPLDVRGRSSGLALHPSPFGHLMVLLMLPFAL
ncbi:stereocilin [Esox lucius]|uniref:stereocilin n=1 Tax=Esox lucius TaxID=8010 RepID=UPI0014769978|nr:stereocilin [Esox lucius]